MATAGMSVRDASAQRRREHGFTSPDIELALIRKKNDFRFARLEGWAGLLSTAR